MQTGALKGNERRQRAFDDWSNKAWRPERKDSQDPGVLSLDYGATVASSAKGLIIRGIIFFFFNGMMISFMNNFKILQENLQSIFYSHALWHIIM